MSLMPKFLKAMIALIATGLLASLLGCRGHTQARNPFQPDLRTVRSEPKRVKKHGFGRISRPRSSISRVPRHLALKPTAPNCKVSKIPVPQRQQSQPTQELLEIARLQLELNCYQHAELSTRNKLNRLQKFIRKAR